MRVGSFIVRLMNVTLEILTALVLVGATVGLGLYYQMNDMNPIPGAILGLIGGIIIIAVIFGIAFLFLEMNNNIIAVKESIDKLISRIDQQQKAIQNS